MKPRLRPSPSGVVVRAGVILTVRQQLEQRRQEVMDLLERTPLGTPLHDARAQIVGRLNAELVAMQAPNWKSQ